MQPTSILARDSIEPDLQRLEKVVVEYIKFRGDATCDEVEAATGLSHQTASARIRGLAQRGVIEDSGRTRKTRSGRKAITWRAK